MIARTTRTLLEIIAASALGIMLLTGVAAWRLAQGPIPLEFLTQHLVRALNSQDAPFRVTVEQTILAWAGWERALDIRVVGVAATGDDGKVVARVPEMSVSMSLPALLQGVVAPRSLDLIGASVRLVRTPAGEFAMTLGPTDDDSGADLLGRIVASLGAAPDTGRPITYLRRVSILGAGLTIDDRLTGAVWGAPQADIILLREQGEIRGAFFAELDIGGSTTRINGAASWRPKSDLVRIEAEVAGARIDRIAAKLPQLRIAEALDIGVNGRVNLALHLSGALRTAKFDLTAGQGHITYASLWPEGLPVKSVRLRGQFDGDTESLDLEAFSVNLGETTLSGRVSALKVGDGISVDARLEVDRLSLSELGRYWPVSVGPLARGWVTGNMPGGIAEDARASLSLRMAGPGDEEISLVSLSGTLRLRDTTIHYLDGMPPVRDAAATAVFSRDRFIAKVRHGSASGLTVRSGTVRLTKLDTDDQQAEIDLSIEGSLADALALVDRPRLGFASRFGLDPRSVDGQATTRLKVGLPMDRAVQLAGIRIDAASRLRDVRIPGLVYGQPVSAKALSLKVDKSRLEVTGEARVADVPAAVKWVERFDDEVRYARQYEARAVLDEAQRTALGIVDLAPYLRGPVPVQLAIMQPPEGPREVAVSAALKDATLAIPALQWRKEAGRDGVARLDLLLADDGAIRVRELDIQTPSLLVNGSLRLNRERRLIELDIRRFRQGRNDLTGRVKAGPGGRYDVLVTGAALDAHPFIERVETDDGKGSPLPPMTIRADIDRVWINRNTAVENLSGEMIRDASAWTGIALSGAMGEGRSLSLSFASEGPVHRVRVQSDDAGEFLRGLEIIDTVQGGRLILSLSKRDGEGEAPWTGNLEISDFVLAGAPLMAQILTSASLTGIADMMAGNGIRFAKLDAPLVMRDGVVTIRNARTVGSELGVTAEGYIDTNSDRLALSGTIVPAYTLNSLVGNIPVLGDILTGKKGSGIFAATYRAEGPTRKPTVTVNPLAALAPGFLRNLIGIFDGTSRIEQPPPRAPSDTN